MQTKRKTAEIGNVLICVLGSILILGLIAANVLQSSVTRLNASTNQVRAWKEALSAAETGGDIAFAELRKRISSPSSTPWVGWTQSGTKYTSPLTILDENVRTQTVVEECYFDPTTKRLVLGTPASGNPWYRLRSKGTASLPGVKRTGMDDALIQDGKLHFAAFGSTTMQDITARGNGDSLLRKIDFEVDHFVSTYGPNGDGLNKASIPPTSPPSISRRTEQFVTPVTPFFDAAIKSAGSFYGLGSAAYIDSYNSNNGPYDPTVKDNPSSPYYKDSRRGNVEIGTATATVMGTIYGDVATNGGNVVNASNITGTVDNNVPFILEDYKMPNTTTWNYIPFPNAVNSNQNLAPLSPGTSSQPNYYLFSSIANSLTLSPAVVSGTAVDTYVAIRVTSDISGNPAAITVKPKVHVKIYFDGDISIKNNNIVNQSPSAANPYAGNLQFYGISPPRDASGNPTRTQTINLNSGTPSTVAATFYAPSADVHENGNPDFIGTIVCKSFYANGNITWHYDRALNDDGVSLDFRIVSYIEDTR